MIGEILRREGVIGTLLLKGPLKKNWDQDIFNPIFMCGTPPPEESQYVGAAERHERQIPGENQYLEKTLQTN